MKTRLILSLALIFISVNLIAEDGIKTVKNLVENKVEETIIYNEKTKEPIKKADCYINSSNQVTDKVVYKWDRRLEWIPVRKFTMMYETEGCKTPCSVSSIAWDSRRGEWDKSSKAEMECIK